MWRAGLRPNLIGGGVLHHGGVDAHHGAGADGHFGHDRGTVADPHVVADHHVATLGRVALDALAAQLMHEDVAEGIGGGPVDAVVAAQEHGDLLAIEQKLPIRSAAPSPHSFTVSRWWP